VIPHPEALGARRRASKGEAPWVKRAGWVERRETHHRAARLQDGFRGACHRAGHFGPDPLAQPILRAALYDSPKPKIVWACGASSFSRNGFATAIEPKRAPSAMSSEKIVVHPASAAEASSTLSQ